MGDTKFVVRKREMFDQLHSSGKNILSAASLHLFQAVIKNFDFDWWYSQCVLNVEVLF